MTQRSVKVFSLQRSERARAQGGRTDRSGDPRTRRDPAAQSAEPETEGAGISDLVLKDVEIALQAWSDRITELGGNPKGYFTVDFQSIDPEMTYCWNYGEDSIGHTHKVWENFSHRRPLTESIDAAGEHLKWVN